MAAKPIPDGFNSVSSYLVVSDVGKAIRFYEKAFGAKAGTIMKMPGGDGIMHAEIRIGDSTVMLSQENPEWGSKSAETLGGSPVSMHIYVEDADALFRRAVEAGCEVKAPLMDAFWGDRYGKLTDPFGLDWGVGTHKEDLSEEEMARRAAEWFASLAEGGGQ